MTPANEFPGNIIFYVLFVGFLSFFAWSAATSVRWFHQSRSRSTGSITSSGA